MSSKIKVFILCALSLVLSLSIGCMDTPTVPLPPPDLTVISSTSPDTDGFVTVVGGQTAAESNSVILLYNSDTKSGVMETATENGSFTAKLAASEGNVLILQYKIDTTVSYEEYILIN